MTHRTTYSSLIIATALVVLVSGCASPYIRYPNINDPGTAEYQRAAAIEHDPYLLDDVGPDVVGGRPLGYQRPVREVERARMFAQPPQQLRPVPLLNGPAPWTQVTPAAPAPYPVGPPLAPGTSAPPPVFTQPSGSQPVPFQQQIRSPY